MARALTDIARRTDLTAGLERLSGTWASEG
jgi:hypothetical protein